MKIKKFLIASIIFSCLRLNSQEVASQEFYLEQIKAEMKVEWPKNRTINLVFHGHSVPAGYFKTPIVNTLASYPYIVLEQIKSKYPFTVVNIINTSIGGENSESGAKRFESQVLNHNPDVVFIDYALNDRGIGLVSAKIAWEKMIRAALDKNIKVILLTPSPDQTVDIKDDQTILDQHARQIIQLSKYFNVGLIDTYGIFKNKIKQGVVLVDLMSQVNHPNANGHQLIADEIMKYFK
ncbi:MAG: SGNH/GDSL hydrolase family protein [Bacteroidetes bacterium]|nr:SGNH/GDSL hydrolase family protein [Bacteroidota bacterium]